MEDHVVLRNLEVEVHFHPALVGVGRHRVPYAAALEYRHAHGQLAGLQHRGMDELVDHPLVAGGRVAAGFLGRVRDFDQFVLIAAVRRRGNNVELCGLLRVVRAEKHFLRAAGDVQAVLVAQLVHRSVHAHLSGAADVEHAAFPALEEIIRSEVMPDVDALINGYFAIHRHDSQRDHPVHVAVNSRYLIRLKQFFNQELPADLLCGVAFEILLVAAVPNVHVRSLHIIEYRPS